MPRLGGSSNYGRLNGSEKRAFLVALNDAFRTRKRMQDMLNLFANRNWDSVTDDGEYDHQLLTLINNADDDDWTTQLLAAARDAAPTNVALIEFAAGFGLSPLTKPTRELEREVREQIHGWDVLPFLSKLGSIECCVCRVEVRLPGKVEYGTGFLLGSELLMTNYHVMEKVTQGQGKPEDVLVRFDYKMQADREKLLGGTVYHLAKNDWIVAQSKYSSLDEMIDTGSKEPTSDELDYVLLRVANAPGNDPVGGPDNQDPEAKPRRWISIGTYEPKFEKDTPLFILEHPRAEPLKLFADTTSIIGFNSNKTRVRYRTNTERGASGSPCFDAEWNLIALHHSGDPDYSTFHKAEYNQGIPIQAIRQDLKDKGILDQLGQ